MIELKNLYNDFRDAKTIKAYAKLIEKEAESLGDIRLMEVCGGHTHTIMKYGLNQLMAKNISFIHGPGCPVCVMPKIRIDYAHKIAMQKGVIMVTLGDMIKVTGSNGSLQNTRGLGADVRFVYSPMEALKIAKENPTKEVVFFAIGFETTTPMSAILLQETINQNIKNLFIYSNHITVPEVMQTLLDSDEVKINGFIAPSHVSVISGAKIYSIFAKKYKLPVVVAGFEPVDMMEGILMLLKQLNSKKSEVQIQYKRAVNFEGNKISQELIEKYFKKSSFEWRGVGEVALSGVDLKEEYNSFNAKIKYKEILKEVKPKKENPLCICGDILRGVANPLDCTIFAKSCTPTNPVGSCMVSSEGACSAYFKYGGQI